MEVLKQWEKKHQKKINNTYKNCIANYISNSNLNLEKATYSDVINYVSLLRKLGLSASNLANHVSAIKFYYSCLIDLKQLKNHPCKTLVLKDRIDTSIAIETLYSKKELETFLQRKTQGIKLLELRNKIMRQFLVYQGLTASELINIKLTDLDLENCTLSIKNSRKLALNAKQLLPLQVYILNDRELLKKGKQTDILVLSKTAKPLPPETINAMLNQGANNKLTPQKIRQSVIYNLLKEGNDLRKVQLFAGHKCITTTEQYKSCMFEELRSQLEKKHPLR